jgi:hypothetical protein
MTLQFSPTFNRFLRCFSSVDSNSAAPSSLMVRYRAPSTASVSNAAVAYCRSRAQQFVASGHNAIAADYIIRGLSYRRREPELLELGAAVGAAVGQPELAAKCRESLAALNQTLALPDIAKNDSERLTVATDSVDEINQVIAESQAEHLISCVKLAGYGRALVAKVDLPKGEQLLAEKPMFAARRTANYCAQCLAPLLDAKHRIPCGGQECAESYCGVECRAQAHGEGHAKLCESAAFRQLSSSLAADVTTEGRGNASVALSMLVAIQMAVRGSALGVHPLLQEGVAELSGAITYEPCQTLDNTGALAVEIGEVLGQPHFFLEDLMTLFAKVQTNEFVSPAGSAVFRVLSMLNHSCVPNTIVDFDANAGHAILRTAAKVARGQQLFIDYTAGQGAALPYARRQQLLSQRHFDCYCARCVRRV